MAEKTIEVPPKATGPLDIDDSFGPDLEQGFLPHPFLKRPLLYVSGVDPATQEGTLAGSVFKSYLPVRLHLNRSDPSTTALKGTVEFQSLEKAEKALATIQYPRLSINEKPVIDPKPAAQPRLIKQLPPSIAEGNIYDLFRPYGPLQHVTKITTSPRGHETGFKGMAFVTFYREEHAQRAQGELHCTEIEGRTISVSVESPKPKSAPQFPEIGPQTSVFPAQTSSVSPPASHNKRVSVFSPAASAFVPSGLAGGSRTLNAAAPAFEPPSAKQPEQNPHVARPIPQQAAAAGGATIDPCNLFIKNLDASVDSDHLFQLFKKFGSIVSARAMHDESGKSKEFGFVSFKRPEDARKALNAMNNVVVNGKQLVVRIHEPKALRQDKLAAKFGPAFHAPKDEAMMSPSNPAAAGGWDTSSEADTATNRLVNATNGSEADAPVQVQASKGNKSETSTNDSNINVGAGDDTCKPRQNHVDLAQLQKMSSTLQGDILRGGFSRRIRELKSIPNSEVDFVVSALSQLDLSDAVDALNDEKHLLSQVRAVRAKEMPADAASSTNANAAESETASVTGASLSSALPNGASERERIAHAVSGALPEESNAADITDLLMGLPKKERAMALFNQDYLRTKIEEAKAIVEMRDEEDDKENVNYGSSPPLTKANLDKAQESGLQSISQNGYGARPSLRQAYTMTQLAKLPAAEIVRLASSPEGAHLPLPKADPETVKETDLFIDGLQNLAVHDQKQKLGDQLFKKIRSYGVKGAPRITIALLDSEDLRALAHLLNSFEGCLREKVALRAGVPLK